jgi:hypothetical protein
MMWSTQRWPPIPSNASFSAQRYDLFFFFIVTIAFKSMASAYDGCSYHQVKTPIDFLYRQNLNPGPLLDGKKLYQLS